MSRFPNIFFKDSYLELSYPERLIAKAVGAAIYSMLVVLALIFVTDQGASWRALAILLALFLGDLLLRCLRGERTMNGELLEELARGKKLNVAPFFSFAARDVLERAVRGVELAGGKAGLAPFIIKELAATPEVTIGFLRLGIERKAFVLELLETARQSQDSAGPPLETVSAAETAELAKAAFEEAAGFGEINVSATALFLGALNLQSPQLEALFARFNFAAADFRNAVIFGRLARGLGRRMRRRRGAAGRSKITHRVMNRAWTARPTPILDRFGEDITDLARNNIVGFMVGHANEYRTLINVLSRENKNNALLVGLEGAGKDTIAGHLAFRITRDEVPAKLFDRRLVRLSITALTANVKTPGELEARLEKIVEEIILAGNVVLYLPDIHSLKLTSADGAMNAFDALKPVFQASVIPTVATSDPYNYRRVIEQDQDFRTLFEKIDVEELTPAESLTLLTYESYLLEAQERITISYPALKRAVELAHRYLRQKPLPVSAVDLLQEALAETKNRGDKVLEETVVAEIVSRKTRIPVMRPREAETELLMRLEDKIHKRLINQEEAVKQVASAMRQYRAGIGREKGPIAAFLFAGPTGVGKTELAKTLAAIYFGGEQEMVRFDMSEYKDPRSIWNFIGSPDGEVAGNLVEAVKARPFAVLLLDEFEKAHRDILEIFLPIFDEGYTTSSLGEKIDMQNMIIIATSNAHSDLIKAEVEAGRPFAEIGDLLKKRLTEYFKPELLNRFDGVIAFRQLNPEEISKIAALQLAALARRLAEEQGIVIEIGAGVAEYIAKLGWDPVFGARPLRGVVSAKVREMLAKKILSGEMKRGSKGVLMLEGEEIVIR